MIRRLALGVALLPAALLAAPQEVARTYVLNEEAILYEDGTWAFASPNVAITVPTADTCITSSDGRVSFCPDGNDWQDRQIVTADGYEDHFMTGRDARFALTAAIDRNYGHDGDMAEYSDLVSEPGLFERLLFRAAQLDMPDEQLMIQDDIVVIVSDMIETGPHFYHTLEIILPDHSFYFDLSTDTSGVTTPSFDNVDDLQQAAAAHRARLIAAITIDDRPFSEFAGKIAQ